MVSFPPLSPSARWWSMLMKQLSETAPESEAIIAANSLIYSSKEFGRYSLQDSRDGIITLSLAVEGGGRQLRSLDKIEGAKLSEHGDWRRNHLGAIEACLGRKPFFRDMEEALIKVYSDIELSSLKSFNTAIYKTILSFLIGEMEPSELSLFSRKEALKNRGEEIALELNPDISILQALANHGRETLLALMALKV